MTEQTSYKKPLVFAAILHLILFVALFLHFAPQMHLASGSQVKIVHATLVDQKGFATKMMREPKPEPQKIQPIEEKVTPPVPKLAPPPDLKQQQAAQQQAHEAQVVVQQAAAAKLMQQQKAQQAKAAKIKQQQLAVAAAAKRKAQQQKVKQQLQAAQQQLIQQQMTQEQQQLAAAAAAAQNQADQSEIDKYKAMIVQMISQNWLVPDNASKDLSCQLLIQVGPGGVVLNVQVITSSGNPQLDDSAVAAVMKASPLPVPDDPKLFDKFRKLRLTVKPENISSQ